MFTVMSRFLRETSRSTPGPLPAPVQAGARLPVSEHGGHAGLRARRWAQPELAAADQRVHPRHADAAFIWTQDRKQPLAGRREALFALYAFNHEVAKIGEELGCTVEIDPIVLRRDRARDEQEPV